MSPIVRVDYSGCAPQAKVSTPKPRERESFPGRPVIKARVKKKLPRKFPVPFHVFSGHDMAERWQNWILVKASSRFVDRHRHFHVIPGSPSLIPLFSPFCQFKLHFITNFCNCDGRAFICFTEKLCVRCETLDSHLKRKTNIPVATM